MPRGNIDNLIVPSSEQARKNGSKGGIASGKKRAEKKMLQESLQKLLKGKYKIETKEGEVKIVSGYEAISESMVLEALKGNVKAFVAIRDTIGEKPTETVDFKNEEVQGISIEFVNKSNKNNHLTGDPKIVGEYTPPSNTEN